MWQGVIIDIIFMIILAIAAYHGYKNGAVKVVLGFLVIILVIPIVYFTYKPVTNFVIKNTSIHENLKMSVYTSLESKNINETGKLEEDGEFLPVLTRKINDFITKAKDEHYNDLADKVSDEVATFAIQIFVILAWSIILFILLTILKLIIVKAVDVIPIINILNYALGTVLQVVKAIIIVFVILYLLQFVLPIIKSTFVQDSIEKTNLIKYMYNNNVINTFIK